MGFFASLESRKISLEKVQLLIQGKQIAFDIDSGACRTVMHIKDLNKYLSGISVYTENYDLKVLRGNNVDFSVRRT